MVGPGAGGINQLAVAEVLARHLWNHPRAAGDVRRAAAPAQGHRLPGAVRQAAQPVRAGSCSSTRSGSTGARGGPAAGGCGTARGSISVLSGSPGRWRRASEEELQRRAGPAPAPDPVHARPRPRRRRRPDRPDQDPAGHRGHGGRRQTASRTSTTRRLADAGDGRRAARSLTGDLRTRSATSMYATDIPLAKTLDVGETITLEYWTTFQYPGNPADPHERAVPPGGDGGGWRTSTCGSSSTPTGCPPASGGRAGTGSTGTIARAGRGAPWTASTRRTGTCGSLREDRGRVPLALVAGRIQSKMTGLGHAGATAVTLALVPSGHQT